MFERLLRLRFLAALFVLVGFLTGSSGCGDDPPSALDKKSSVSIEPRNVVFHPDTGEVAVRLVNRTKEAVALDGFRVEGTDWGAFAITDAENPRTLPATGTVEVHVKVEPDELREAAETASEPGDYRPGSARIRFQANGVAHDIPLTFEAPSWISQYLWPSLIKIALLVLAFIMPLASLLTWMERKQSAMMQDRLGPNMAGIDVFGTRIRLWGLLHIAADGLKMFFKEDFVPRRAHKALYTLAPLLAFIPALAVFAIVPFGDGLCYGQLWDVLSQADIDQCVEGRGGTVLQVAHIDVGLLFYFAIASLAAYGTTLAGWSSYNKWAILGGLRATAQMISYEVAIGLTIVGALLVYGTLEPHALVRGQIDSYWGVILQPLALVLFFTAAMAETKRAPFDLPEGESEIIGYFIEYSGMRFGVFFLAEFIEVAFAAAMVATLFFGGWALPFGMLGAGGFSSPLAAQMFFLVTGTLLTWMGVGAWRASKHAETIGVLLVMVGVLHVMVALWSVFTGWGTSLPHLVIVLIGMITWGVKVLLLCWVQLLVRWTLPRFRYDQLMDLGWKGLLPLSIANIIVTAILVYFLLPGGGPQS